ncbi:MAG TPA: enoyl-CoA hydratase/isomerase family protein [Thermoanaerobaculia bacterium]|nr:enoyl-CoA hydratase/isomerase family protein [Thermoanaerobaculia bacterium]
MIVTTDHGPVRELRLNRPPVNALSPELIAALQDAVTRAPNEGARALVISGSPGRFSGGLDIPVLVNFDRAGMERLWEALYRLLLSLAASPIPIAAAITGHSPAGGAVLATYCDYRIQAEGEFRIGFNEVQVGIPMPPAILRCIARQVGPRQAERLCGAGVLILPEEARRIGLVDELVPPDRVVERAIEWANGMLALPPVAMAQTRKAVRADLVRLMEEGLATEGDLLLDNWFSEESQTTLRAVVERMKRK